MSVRPGRISKEWLPYIRPHLRPYEALGRGDRRDYIAKLSKKVMLSDNTLRRFIAAAQFLEAEGITELPPGIRMPVAAVERVARIAAREPERRRELLREIAEGKLTIAELRQLLKKSNKAAARRQRASAPAEPLEDRVMRELEARGVGKRDDMVVSRADEETCWWLFATPMKPSFILHLPEARRVLVMDDRTSHGTGASFMWQRREFLRHILAGAGLYGYVFVYASIWQEDVDKLMQAMRPEVRARVILIGPEG
jgi:hypothetical protein